MFVGSRVFRRGVERVDGGHRGNDGNDDNDDSDDSDHGPSLDADRDVDHGRRDGDRHELYERRDRHYRYDDIDGRRDDDIDGRRDDDQR